MPVPLARGVYLVDDDDDDDDDVEIEPHYLPLSKQPTSGLWVL